MPLEVRRSKGWGRVTTASGSDSIACELCKANRRQYPRGGNMLIWALGRPLIRTCRPCAKEMQSVWTGAGGEA